MTVVVTGGMRRLGKVIAEHLRGVGWRVITTSHRADAGADIVADLSEEMGAARLYAAALKLNGGNPPDALVNNAALFTGDEAAIRMVNFVSPQKLTMLMAGRETGGRGRPPLPSRGVVVNVLDSVVQVESPSPRKDDNFDSYLESKRALAEDTVKAAAMFADTLRVNGVAPGPVLPPEGVHVKAAATPLGRPTPESVAAAVAFLLAAPFTTGCILPVDGGAQI